MRFVSDVKAPNHTFSQKKYLELQFSFSNPSIPFTPPFPMCRCDYLDDHPILYVVKFYIEI